MTPVPLALWNPPATTAYWMEMERERDSDRRTSEMMMMMTMMMMMMMMMACSVLTGLIRDNLQPALLSPLHPHSSTLY